MSDGHSPSTSNNDSSDIPISVTVTTDLEPVVADGFLRRTVGGFCVMFFSGNVEYIITHDMDKTVLKTVGEQSYELVLGSAPTHTTILTPFGSLGLTVRPKVRTVTETNDGINISLKYALDSHDSGVMLRAVDIAVTYKGTL